MQAGNCLIDELINYEFRGSRMIGFAHHNVAVVSSLVDRKSWSTHTIIQSELDWLELFKGFLGRSAEGRSRVVLFKDTHLIDRLQMELRNMPAEHAGLAASAEDVVFGAFDSPDRLMVVQGLEVIDAEFQGDSWKCHRLDPAGMGLKFSSSERGLGNVVVRRNGRPKAA